MVNMFTLKRIASTALGTIGVLLSDGIPFATTIEDPWLENRKNTSCIPTGVYKCVLIKSDKFGYTFEITNVPGRSHILFHKGNTQNDTEGCICVGLEFTELAGQPAILKSREGFEKFLSKTSGLDSFMLKVENCF